MKLHLSDAEFVEADDIYKAERSCVKTRDGWLGMNQTSNDKVGSRHETVNGRFKDWNCLKEPCRHSIEQHSTMFWSVVVLNELRIENGEPLFDVDYND